MFRFDLYPPFKVKLVLATFNPFTLLLVQEIVGGYRCATSWCDLNRLSTLSKDIDLLHLVKTIISETIRCRKLIVGRDIG